MALLPPVPPFDGRPFERTPAFTTVPVVTAITPNAGRTAGGTAVTITGLHFRNLPDGSAPTVTFISPDGTVFTATSVVVVSETSITCNTPVVTDGVGRYDVKVAVGTESGTLFGGFTYYATVVSSVDPSFGPIAGGTAVTIKGLNFEAGSTVTFGGTAATGVNRLDDETISATTPNHAVGFVDVVVTGASGSATLRNGFKYTLLTRGEDIRRRPGVNIQDSLNNTPNIASFTIDGDSHTPSLGEQLEILDTEDSNRRLFGGNIQGFSTEYEELTSQIVWRCTGIDYTGLLNKYYPFGYFKNTSVSDIVKFLVQKFAPGFTTTYVQTNLAKATVKLDGSLDFATVLTQLAQLLGSGHWYVDYDQNLHFFRAPQEDSPIAIVRSGPGTALTATEGAAIPAAFSFTPSFISFWSTFVYDNGIESALSPLSDFGAFDGNKQIALSAIPLGPPIGARTVTKRRIYTYTISSVGVVKVARYAQINDNTTEAFTSWYGATGADSAAVVPIASNVALPTPPSVTPPAGSPQQCKIAPGGGQAKAPPKAYFAPEVVQDVSYTPGSYAFKVANIYRDGTESLPTPTSNVASLNGTERGLLTAPVGETLNSVAVIARFVYASYGSRESQARTLAEVIAFLESERAKGTWGAYVGYSDAAAWGNRSLQVSYNELGAGLGYSDIDALLAGEHQEVPPDWSPGRTGMWTLIPNNTETQLYVSPGMGGAGKKPQVNPDNPGDEVPVWPNPDGPNPEDDLPVPDPITQSSNGLLRDPPFTISEDMSQIRNRVYVYGAATQVLNNAAQGASRIDVAELTMFAPSGGWLVVKGHRIEYTTISAPSGQGNITLKEQLPLKVDIGEPVQIAYRGDDTGSQEALGKIELDSDGNPTDGVHEYVIVDASLKTQFELFMRCYAELELFGRPIVTINYATRDVKTRSGAVVAVDMTTPPVKGDFLIQDVTIDQIHDESDELMPRYNVRATSARFDLDDLLLKIIEATIDNPVNPTAGINTVVSGDSTLVSSTRRVVLAQLNPQAAGGSAFSLVGGITQVTTGGGTWTNDDVDANGTGQIVSNATTGARGFIFGSFTRREWLPRCIFTIKTGPSIEGDLAIYCILSNVNSLPTFADPHASSHAYFGVRYSTLTFSPYQGTSITADAGWVGVAQPHASSPFGGGLVQKTPMIAPILANTVYEIIITVVSTSLVEFSVNGSTVQSLSFVPNPQNAAIPQFAAIMGASFNGEDRTIRLRRFYAETN